MRRLPKDRILPHHILATLSPCKRIILLHHLSKEVAALQGRFPSKILCSRAMKLPIIMHLGKGAVGGF